MKISPKSCLFVVDADSRIGLGHFMRCLTLADALKAKKIKSFFLMRFSTPQTRQLVVTRGFQVFTQIRKIEQIVLDSQIDFMIADVSHKKNLKNPSVLNRLLWQARSLGVLTIVFDGLVADCLSRKVDLRADIVVIPYVGAGRLKFGKRTARFLKGEKYFIFRPEFLGTFPRKVGTVNRVLVSMGGADPQGLTVKALEALDRLGGFAGTVIAGAGFRPALKKKIQKFAGRFKILNGSSSMARLMKAADLLITSSGLTKYEAARSGIPTVILPQGDYKCLPDGFEDQKLAVTATRSEVKSVERLVHLFGRVIEDATLRRALVQRGQKVLDGRGLERFFKEGVGI